MPGQEWNIDAVPEAARPMLVPAAADHHDYTLGFVVLAVLLPLFFALGLVLGLAVT